MAQELDAIDELTQRLSQADRAAFKKVSAVKTDETEKISTAAMRQSAAEA